MTYAAGIDVGTSSVKTAIYRVEGDQEERLALRLDRILRRNPLNVAEASFEAALDDAGLKAEEIDYIATTGEGDMIPFRRGHFYTMTTQARGAKHLMPECSAALDVGALHARAISMDSRAKVLQYRMTSQCASGSGQFLENISRYLGLTLEEVGDLSVEAEQPEKISGICAVLAETDVINFVSRGVPPGNIVRGIHDSMANRYIRLLKASKAVGRVAITGGLSRDNGLVNALNKEAQRQKIDLAIETHPDAVFAGAIGAALWGAFRSDMLAQRESA